MRNRILWLSFVDPDLPEGSRSLGVCVIEVHAYDAVRALRENPRIADKIRGPWLIAACDKARETGCNPGGEVLAYDITDHPNQVWVKRLERNRLYSPAEATLLTQSYPNRNTMH